VIQAQKNAKNGFDRSVDRAVELGLGLCFQQNAYRGVGVAREARLSHGIAEIARHRRNRENRGINHKGHNGSPGSPSSRDIAVIGKPGKQ